MKQILCSDWPIERILPARVFLRESFLFNHILINLLSTKLVQSRRLDIGSFCIVIVLDFVSFHKEEDISFSFRDNAVVLSPIWFMAFTYCFSKNSVNALRPENECFISGLYPKFFLYLSSFNTLFFNLFPKSILLDLVLHQWGLARFINSISLMVSANILSGKGNTFTEKVA